MKRTHDFNIIKEFCGHCELTYPDMPDYKWCMKERDICKDAYCPLTEEGLMVPDWGVEKR